MRIATYFLILFFIFTVPFENTIIVAVGSATRVIGLLAFAAWLSALALTNRVRKPNLYIVVFALFVLWSALSILWSWAPGYTTGMIQTYVQLLLLTMIIWDVFTTQENIRAGFWAYLLGCYVAAIMVLRNFLSGVTVLEGMATARFAGGGQDPNDLGVMLAIGVVTASWLSSNTKYSGWLRFACYAYIPVAVFAILLTASRTALVGLTVSFIASFFILSEVKLTTRLITVFVVIISIIGIQPLIPGDTFDRLGQLDESVASGDLEGRGAIWVQGIELFLQHPIIGVGSGAFEPSIELFRAPHNVWIAVATETGVIGFVLYNAALALAVIAAFRHSGAQRIFYLSTILIWVIGAMTLNWEYRKQTWVLFALIVASADTLSVGLPEVLRWTTPKSGTAPLLQETQQPRTRLKQV